MIVYAFQRGTYSSSYRYPEIMEGLNHLTTPKSRLCQETTFCNYLQQVVGLYHLLYLYKNAFYSRFLDSWYACPRLWMRGFHAAYNEFKEEKKKLPPPVLHPLFPLLHTTSHFPFLNFFPIIRLLLPLILLRRQRRSV